MAIGRALADGVEIALPGWVLDCVLRRWRNDQGQVAGDPSGLPPEIRAAAEEAGRRAAAETRDALGALLVSDVDDQTTTPLAVVRGAVRYPTEVLAGAGVPPVARDAYAERAFPADVYDLTPGSPADLAPAVGDLALAWGAAKAFVHMRRHARRS